MLTWILIVMAVGSVPSAADLNNTKYRTKVECTAALAAAYDADMHARVAQSDQAFKGECRQPTP